ncbi:unnamed protein product [Rotaria magnacalcarata]|uniref:G protein-coupled receptor n=1 Tax=Rotaria magnacalcarata TaxID=392030 RepID=A0A816B1L5_9BILA|nr:unnamed protein product [Rotaria magnacalcarata]CAF1619934.1 unnamed protein product [Rotaria magnacalcarata]CAF4136063.1 unnamed protein product [Rotaria magnacalcarata]CAF4183070.1 unnamed protein product [Rotaria magnacalcarata]
MSHEFIYRGLFDDYEEQRVWCVFHYSESIQRYSTAIQRFHFIVPFLMNLFSAVCIICTLARRRAAIQSRQRYAQHLLVQLKKNKQLIVSPIVLVILSIPRLLITLFSGCVKVSRSPWLYLLGYLVSFIPPALVFIIFVLPSTTYKKVFTTMIMRWRRRFFRQ